MRVDIETGDIRALTPGPGVRSYVQQVSARFPGELLLSHNQRDKAYFDIYRVNVATGDSTLLSIATTALPGSSPIRISACRFGIRYRDNGDWDVVTVEGDRRGHRCSAPSPPKTAIRR